MSKQNNGGSSSSPNGKAFLTDVTELRRRAREKLERGAVTDTYEGNLEKTIDLLNGVLATEIVCTLRYRYHAVCATGLPSNSVKSEFEEHARDEQLHADWVAERINELGGNPNMNPEGLAMRSASQYVEGTSLSEMIKEDLVAERIAIEHYQEVVRYFANHDPTSRRLIEKILAKEEEHASDMHDLLEGRFKS
jgi:bacterioferritin